MVQSSKPRLFYPVRVCCRVPEKQIERVRFIHEQDLKSGIGPVYLRYALERKYLTASRELNGKVRSEDRYR